MVPVLVNTDDSKQQQQQQQHTTASITTTITTTTREQATERVRRSESIDTVNVTADLRYSWIVWNINGQQQQHQHRCVALRFFFVRIK